MHTDEQGVTLPDAGFAEALADAALTIAHGGEQRSLVLLTMASHRVAQRLLPLTLEALSRIPADQGLDGVKAQLLPVGSSIASVAGATAFSEHDLGRAWQGGGGGGSSSLGAGDEEEEEEQGRRRGLRQYHSSEEHQLHQGRAGQQRPAAARSAADAELMAELSGDSRRRLARAKASTGGGEETPDARDGETVEETQDRREVEGEEEEDGEAGDSSRSRNSGGVTGRTLASALVVMTWDKYAQDECWKLKERYGHQCLQDVAHKVGPAGEADGSGIGGGGGGAAAFHSAEFVAIGFAKIKYLVNALSLGYDVMAMDADVVVLRSPLPLVLPLRPHLAVLTEKCEVVDMAQPLQPKEVRKPGSNIGVMFLRSEGPALRCMSRWFQDMTAKTDNPRLWDQEEFDKVITACAPRVGLRWHALDNRRFVSMCQPGCGCSFPDSDMQLLHVPSVVKQHKRDWWRREGQPYADPVERSCGPEQWRDWVLVHYPCQGGLSDKERYMAALLDGYAVGEPRVIKNTKKIIKRARQTRRRRGS